MRKIVLLALVMMLILAGCGGDPKPANTKPTNTAKISYQDFQRIKKQFKQINDMFVFDPINDEIVSAMANPDEFKGDRGTQLEANLKTHETELLSAKRFFVKKHSYDKVNAFNQAVSQSIDKKIEAYAQALDYMKTKNAQSKTFYVEYNGQALGFVDQASQIVNELETEAQ